MLASICWTSTSQRSHRFTRQWRIVYLLCPPSRVTIAEAGDDWREMFMAGGGEFDSEALRSEIAN
jgi:hypothetical protein